MVILKTSKQKNPPKHYIAILRVDCIYHHCGSMMFSWLGELSSGWLSCSRLWRAVQCSVVGLRMLMGSLCLWAVLLALAVLDTSISVATFNPPGASQVALVVKNAPANSAGIMDTGSIPESGRSPGGGNGNLLQYSSLGNPTDRGAWGLQSMGSQRVRRDWSELARAHTHTHTHTHIDKVQKCMWFGEWSSP